MTETAAWQQLRDELDRWQEAGRQATFWWRDDDAVAPTPALERMLHLAQTHDVPLGLAVIPVPAMRELAWRLEAESRVQVLLHGYTHTNHAPPGERAAEFGAHRPLALRTREIADGWERLGKFIRCTPIFVPPWNRYSDDLITTLSDAGLAAISAFGSRRKTVLRLDTVHLNTHCDIVAWRTTRGFKGVAKSVGALVEHLGARRTGEADPAEATGLLTHHLVHDEGCWSFLGALLERTRGHGGVRWLDPAAALAEARR